jgi:hypothetical protein
MPSAFQARLSEIQKMLDECLPGTRPVPKKHKIWVLDAKGRSYRGLPKGKHGKTRADPEIEVQHAIKMARFFGIEDCAKRYFDL